MTGPWLSGSETSTSAPREDGRERPGSTASTVLLFCGANLALAGILAGTTSSAPARTPQSCMLSEWTSTGRTRNTVTGPDAPGNFPKNVTEHGARTKRKSDRELVRQIHVESGLTWEQLGRFFGVSRRAVHLWANGGRMNAIHVEHLHRLAWALGRMPAGSPEARRSELLTLDADGRNYLDRLRDQEQLPAGEAAGSLFSPDQLLGALHDRIPTEP